MSADIKHSPSTPLKVSPSKLRRASDRDTAHALRTLFSEPESKSYKLHAMSEKVTCGTFVYAGDKNTLGPRWTTWLERFTLYVAANAYTDPVIIKANFLLLIGLDAYEIYKTKTFP